jgi:hypothetical protein
MKGKICEFCQRENHTIDVCNFKNGFPDSFKFKPKNQKSAINNLMPSDNCNTNSVTDSQQSKSLNISKEDYEMLIDMLQKAKTSNPESSINQL